MNRNTDKYLVQHQSIEAILKKESAEAFVHAIYEILHVPTIVFDETIALIAYAFPRPFEFQDWEEIVEYGVCPKQKVLKNLRDYQEVIYRNQAPTLITWGSCEDIPQTCCPIMYQGFMYGYIGMAPKLGDDIDTIMEIEGIMAKTLGRLLNFTSEKNVLSPEQYVNHLLLRDYSDAQIVGAYESQFSPPYLLAILESPVVNEAELQYILGHICRTQPSVIGCAFESRHLYLLISGMARDTAKTMISRHLCAVALQTDYYVGISDSFDSIKHLPRHKMQAIRALSAGRNLTPKEHYFSFCDVYMDIICFYAIERYGPSASVPYALQKLVSFDEHGDKKYRETLSCYIDNSMRLSATANALNLPPNTVRIRLEKISDLLNVDLEDFRTVQQLEVGLRMYQIIKDGRYKGKFAPYNSRDEA
ncbi:MAG: helix-turn-helix domain-containing protein [Oscillospiraceae bacterium]